jgi:hypothetical protein
MHAKRTFSTILLEHLRTVLAKLEQGQEDLDQSASEMVLLCSAILEQADILHCIVDRLESLLDEIEICRDIFGRLWAVSVTVAKTAALTHQP